MTGVDTDTRARARGGNARGWETTGRRARVPVPLTGRRYPSRPRLEMGVTPSALQLCRRTPRPSKRSTFWDLAVAWQIVGIGSGVTILGSPFRSGTGKNHHLAH